MGYEVDFLGVGKESQSGDAIAIRYGNLYGQRSEQRVIVIDGGFKDTGTNVVNHIKIHYNTTEVDMVISTHPDQDHINGLEVVLEELDVGVLLIHQPWNHNAGLADKFHDGRVTDDSLGEKLKNNLEAAYSLCKLAESKGVLIYEPFTGLNAYDQAITILGPSTEYYESLIPEFDGMPASKSSTTNQGLLSVVAQALENVRNFFVNWGEDKIDDEGETSAKNNSSVITQLIIDDKRFIFTGDAGIDALHYAADELDDCINSAELKFIQIPHHGSRRNIGPSVLNRLIGPPIPQNETRNITAFVSCAKKGEPKHPRKSVLNAFTHRGVKIVATRGEDKCQSNEAPERNGWFKVDAEPYHWQYDE